jgi:hypothetical protein
MLVGPRPPGGAGASRQARAVVARPPPKGAPSTRRYFGAVVHLWWCGTTAQNQKQNPWGRLRRPHQKQRGSQPKRFARRA